MKIIDDIHETHFRYDGLDRRVGIVEKENGVEQSNLTFIWDGTEIVQKRASDGSTIQRNYFSNGFSAHSAPSAVQHYYYTKDHLGSIREVVASDGTTVESIYDYSPWGEVTKTGGTGVESDFLYTSHFYHSTSDLHLTLYRAYDPELGMWLSRDPIAENGGLNLYAYVLNDPINYWDPYGLCLKSKLKNAWDKFKETTSLELGVGLGIGAKGKLGPLEGKVGADTSLSGQLSLDGNYKTISQGGVGASAGFGNHQTGVHYGGSSYIGGRNGGGSSSDTVVGYQNKATSASSTSVGLSGTLGVIRAGVSADPIAVAKELLKESCD